MVQEFQIGSVGASVILSIILRMIYGTWEVSNKIKPWIAVGIGMGLATVVMLATIPNCTLAACISWEVQGFMVGATATGLYEMTKTSK